MVYLLIIHAASTEWDKAGKVEVFPCILISSKAITIKLKYSLQLDFEMLYFLYVFEEGVLYIFRFRENQEKMKVLSFSVVETY